MGTNFGGVHVGCHCWVPLLGLCNNFYEGTVAIGFCFFFVEAPCCAFLVLFSPSPPISVVRGCSGNVRITDPTKSNELQG